jgi:hypothetical protein
MPCIQAEARVYLDGRAQRESAGGLLDSDSTRQQRAMIDEWPGHVPRRRRLWLIGGSACCSIIWMNNSVSQQAVNWTHLSLLTAIDA